MIKSLDPALNPIELPNQFLREVGRTACYIYWEQFQDLNELPGHVSHASYPCHSIVDKARHVQDAGAIAIIVVDNAPGPVIGLGGSDPAIAIPAVRVSQVDGNAIRAQLQRRTRTQSGVSASLGVDPTRLAGTDDERRLRLYTPTVYQPGSSVSHYTTDAKPNQLMEPSINGDLTHEVEAPRDLTLPLLKDIGW